MKALGKGSIASFIRWGLGAAWWFMWFVAFCISVGAVICIGFFTLLAAHVIKIEVHETSVLAYAPFVAIGFTIGAIVIGGTLAIIWRLRRLFSSFSSGDPFHKSNADHLRWIWILLLLMEVSRYLLMALTGALLAVSHLPDGAEAHFEWTEHGPDLSTWFVILILIVLAEVFREGARLREEQELTI